MVVEQVSRTRLWLQSDQRMHWEGQIRRRRKLLDAARQELMSARLSGLRMTTTTQENNVRKCKAAVEEAEEKLRNVKRWSRDFDHLADPLVKRLESLRYHLDYELPKASRFSRKRKDPGRLCDRAARAAAPPRHPRPTPPISRNHEYPHQPLEPRAVR